MARRHEVRSSFRHNDLHNRFPMSRAGNSCRFVVGITAAAGKGRISDASWVFEKRSAGACRCTEVSCCIDRDGSDSSVQRSLSHFVSPSLSLIRRDEVCGIAKWDAIFSRKLFGSGTHE